MPENKELKPNTIQILRNIEAFRERLRNNRNRFKFMTNESNISQENDLLEPIEQVPVNTEKQPKSFINSRGRGYGPNYTWGMTGPATFDNGGNI